MEKVFQRYGYRIKEIDSGCFPSKLLIFNNYITLAGQPSVFSYMGRRRSQKKEENYWILRHTDFLIRVKGEDFTEKKKENLRKAYQNILRIEMKEGFLRIGIPKGKWQLELGMTLDTQFGGYKIGGSELGDLGNGWKDYVRVFFPGHGREDGPVGEHLAFQGNFLGSEYIKMTYRPKEDFSISAYLDNHFDDFSAMAKLNGWDGLWGVEYKSNHRQAINGIVIEYLQTTNMSGPLHGLQNSVVGKTGGADNYYNNGYYPGWAHWGMAIANPLIASPIYNKDGDMSFKYNRVKALHLGWSGDISSEWRYVAKLSHNRTWGTPHRPIPDILENFSTFASFYYIPRKWKGWCFNASLALDMGEIYGDNFGFQLKVHKTF